jgi:hypothetical protein
MFKLISRRVRFHWSQMQAGVRERGRILPVPRKMLVQMVLVYVFFFAAWVVGAMNQIGRAPNTRNEAVFQLIAMIAFGSLAWPTAVLASVQGRSIWGWFLGGLAGGLGTAVLWCLPTSSSDAGALSRELDRNLDAWAFHSAARRSGLNQMLLAVVGFACFGGLIAYGVERNVVYVSGWIMIVILSAVFMLGLLRYVLGRQI